MWYNWGFFWDTIGTSVFHFQPEIFDVFINKKDAFTALSNSIECRNHSFSRFLNLVINGKMHIQSYLTQSLFPFSRSLNSMRLYRLPSLARMTFYGLSLTIPEARTRIKGGDVMERREAISF